MSDEVTENKDLRIVCLRQSKREFSLHYLHYYPGGMQRRWTTQHLCSTTRFNIEQSTPTSPTSQTHSEPVSMIPRCETNIKNKTWKDILTGWTASADSRAGVWFYKATLRVPRSLRQHQRKTNCAEVFVMDQMIHHHHHDIKIWKKILGRVNNWTYLTSELWTHTAYVTEVEIIHVSISTGCFGKLVLSPSV